MTDIPTSTPGDGADSPEAPRTSPKNAYEALAGGADAVLVDVRTPEEWTYVGGPDLSHLGREVVRIPWQDVDGRRNADFVRELRDAGVDEGQQVLFLCRSGARSQQAADAALADGFPGATNIEDGFEGPVDVDGHRGTVAGWKAAALPWRQS